MKYLYSGCNQVMFACKVVYSNKSPGISARVNHIDLFLKQTNKNNVADLIEIKHTKESSF